MQVLVKEVDVRRTGRFGLYQDHKGIRIGFVDAGCSVDRVVTAVNLHRTWEEHLQREVQNREIEQAREEQARLRREEKQRGNDALRARVTALVGEPKTCHYDGDHVIVSSDTFEKLLATLENL